MQMGAFFIVFNIYSKEKFMPRVAAPLVFHPRLQFRYLVFSTKLPGATIHARSAQQPSFDNNPVTIDFMSGYFKMKGKTRWNDITLSCYQFENITANEVYRYFNREHMDVRDAEERFAHRYKHMMQLFLLGPGGLPTARWKLIGAFISNVSWGNMDYGNDEVIECELTITYDYGEFQDAVSTISGLF